MIASCIAPVLPRTAARIEAFLGQPVRSWDAISQPLLGRNINPYEPLITRIDPKQIEAMTAASTEHLEATPSPQPSSAEGEGNAATTSASPNPKPPASNPSPDFISIDDFAKLDVRIGTVLECGFIDGSDKLLRFLLDAGELGQRQIFSGIRAAYGEPEKLIGRKVVFIANLAPRKMRFGVSEGMVLSAGSGGDDLHLLDVDAGAQAGMQVK